MEMDNTSASVCPSTDSFRNKNAYHSSMTSPTKTHKSESLLKRTNILSKLFSKKTYRIHKPDHQSRSPRHEESTQYQNDAHSPIPNLISCNQDRYHSGILCNGDRNDAHSDDYHISVTLSQQSLVPRASSESLDHIEENSTYVEPSGFKPNIPTILEDSTCEQRSSCDNNNSLSISTCRHLTLKTNLLCPVPYNRDSSRKSSTGDSAVDMKFSEDDMTNSSLSSNNCLSSSSCNTEAPNFSPETDPIKNVPQKKNKSADPWTMVRNIIVPFVQQSNKRRYPWIQLSGHQGNFRSGAQGTILKKLCPQEAACLEGMMKDPLSKYVPSYKGITEKDGEKYVEMEDLLLKFENPSIMDCKIGVRTYLEQELTKARKDPHPRKDMYEKMIDVDPDEPKEEEHRNKAVTKPRYMQWRETISSSCQLGFRIEGYKKYDQLTACEFKRIKTKEDLMRSFSDFVDSKHSIVVQYLDRLKAMRSACETSSFFKTHEFIGSSLLFVYDKFEKANVWMIDFGKTRPLDPAFSIDHRSTWIEGNHEDGYLAGLDNIIEIFTAVSQNIAHLEACPK